MGLLDATEQALDLAPDAETLKDVNFFVCVSFCPWVLVRCLVGSASNSPAKARRLKTIKKHSLDDFLSDVLFTIEINVFKFHILAEVDSESIRESLLRSMVRNVSLMPFCIFMSFLADVDLKLRDLPYGVDTAFDSGKGCLPRKPRRRRRLGEQSRFFHHQQCRCFPAKHVRGSQPLLMKLHVDIGLTTSDFFKLLNPILHYPRARGLRHVS